MGMIKGNSFGKSGSTSKTASPNGVSMKNRVGAGPGVNPNKGMPAIGNMSGDRGGSPGIRPNNGGNPRSAAGADRGGGGSGHVAKETKRASSTGYGRVK